MCVQESDQEHDVVRSSGDQRAAAQNLQEPGTEGSAGGETQNKVEQASDPVLLVLDH